MRPDKTKIDPSHKRTIDNWARRALPPGSGTFAILRNDLLETVIRCDEQTLENVIHIVAYLQAEAPAECWGSSAKVKAWRGTQPEAGAES